jgi:hypothetical protein
VIVEIIEEGTTADVLVKVARIMLLQKTFDICDETCVPFLSLTYMDLERTRSQRQRHHLVSRRAGRVPDRADRRAPEGGAQACVSLSFPVATSRLSSQIPIPFLHA